jgi:hypothetical protein
MLWVLPIDGDGEAYREKNFNFEGAVVKRIRNFVTDIDGRDDDVIAREILRRLGRDFGWESIKVIVVLQRQRLYEGIGVPVLTE